MGQIKSTSLTRVPYSMVWENAKLSKFNNWNATISEKLSDEYLSKNINWTSHMFNTFWTWRQLITITGSVLNLEDAYYSELTARLFLVNLKKKKKVPYRVNRGTNYATPGKVNVFNLGTQTFFISNYYFQDFDKAKRLNNTNNELLDTNLDNELEESDLNDYYGDSFDDLLEDEDDHLISEIDLNAETSTNLKWSVIRDIT